MRALSRLSFRPLLLIAFLLIVALLGTVMLRGQQTLEGLVEQARRDAQQTVMLNAELRSLADQLGHMERAARQSVILNDPDLRQRYEDGEDQARAMLKRLSDTLGAEALPLRPWERHFAQVAGLLHGPADTAAQREREIGEVFVRLAALHSAAGAQVRTINAARNEALQDTLADSRQQLGRLALAALVVAVVLATIFGLWLARPFQQIERAIGRLGENQLGEPIEIHGPADLRALGGRLDWLRRRLAELDADKARFVRHVSHELKTPLAALREGVALLEEEVAGPLTDNQREIVGILGHNTLMLQAQIEDLLRFNTLAMDIRRVNREPTELRELVTARVEAQHLQWRARQLAVQVEGGPVTLAVDRDKLGTAVGNLLSNAIRYSPAGGTIRIVLSRQDEGVCIDVIDQGPGIPPAERTRVFEPFYRGEVQPQGAARGTGVGLSIVQEYVAAHGGRVSVLPDTPGAHLRIELPHDD